MRRNKKGFTLIEIIVVIVILAVLMAVAVPSVLKYIDTAQEAPALTECHAIVTAAQKRVIEKYAKNHDDNVSLDDTDNKWIEDFVNEGGTIQGTITVTNKEVTRLLYNASNGLYVLYDINMNPEYSILAKEDIEQTITTVLDNSINEFTSKINDLYVSKQLSKFAGRETVIEKIAKEMSFSKVSENLKNQTDSKTDLYWKPYYLNNVENPSLFLFANYSQTDHGGWNASLIYVSGQIYKCSSRTSISSFYKNTTLESLQSYLDSHPETYTKIDVD